MTRWILYALLAISVIAGGLSYRSHLIDTGHAAGRAEAAAEAQRAQDQAALDAAVVTSESAKRHAATLSAQKAQHDRIVRDLSLALAASDLRATRLSSDLARLHDEAAGLREGLAAAASASGPPAGTPEAPEADASAADLIETTVDNYAICRRNASRLEELQAWYERLRSGRSE